VKCWYNHLSYKDAAWIILVAFWPNGGDGRVRVAGVGLALFFLFCLMRIEEDEDQRLH
jgi:hypothetical protein